MIYILLKPLECFIKLFSNYSFCFVFFWQNNIDAKAARKMLMKLTKEVCEGFFKVVEKVKYLFHSLISVRDKIR